MTPVCDILFLKNDNGFCFDGVLQVICRQDSEGKYLLSKNQYESFMRRAL